MDGLYNLAIGYNKTNWTYLSLLFSNLYSLRLSPCPNCLENKFIDANIIPHFEKKYYITLNPYEKDIVNTLAPK